MTKDFLMTMPKPLSAPTDVFLEITSICNLSCQHCNVHPFRQDPNEFTFDEWVALFDRLVELKVFTVWISGGEPLARPDIFELLEEIDRRPLRIKGFNTNATLVTPEKAARLKALRKLGTVQVGLDGATAESNDKLRGKGSFDRAMRGVKHLVDAGLNVTAFTVFTKYNKHEIRAMAELARRTGIRSVSYNIMLPQGNALNYFDEIALSDEEWRQAIRETGEVAREFPWIVGGPLKQSFDRYETYEDEQAKLPIKFCSNLRGCGAGRSEATIMPDGRVLACDRLQDMTAGNLRDSDLLDIWKNGKPFQQLRQRHSVMLQDLATCRDCAYQRLCTGGCPAVPFNLEGTILARDQYSCYRLFKGEASFRGEGKK